MPKSNRRGLDRLAAATGFSVAGLLSAWRHEEAFRQEVLLAVVLSPVALWLGQSGQQRALLLGSLLLVLIVELLNSAVEAVVDRISDDVHALSAQAKDMGSAAVLLSLLLAAAVWAGVLWDRFGDGAQG